MTERVSAYLEHLPALFHEHPFLGQFLLAFEAILGGAAPELGPGLEQVVGGIDRYFRPLDGDPLRQTPDEFLPWLAGWVALNLREDWDNATRRKFLRQIVPLYRLRGTRAGLRRMLEVYVGENEVSVMDTPADFGFDPPAHFFQVAITLKVRDPKEIARKRQVATAIIEQEKPAHTYYALRVRVPARRLLSRERAAALNEEQLQLGRNTTLGTEAA